MSALIVAGCLAIGAAASMIGVSTKTMRRWDRDGKLAPVFRTAGGHRRYDRRDVVAAIQRDNARSKGGTGSPGKQEVAPRAAVYSRVSSTRQKLDGELDRQVATVRAHCEAKGYRVTATYKDVGSGLNDGRRGLLQLLGDVAKGRHDVVAVSYQDRLSRFGIGVIREFLASWGVRLEVMHPAIVEGTPHAELVTDLTAILYSFMGRLYRARRCRKEGGPVDGVA